MHDIKISLVFCCFNVSEYLDGIYDWLCKQAYENIEVLFIEDCSTDNTKEKLLTLASYPKIMVIQNERNQGLSESRNIGLRNATGDYIGFPDPDDMFSNNWLDDAVEAIESSISPDVVIAGMREDYERNNVIEFSKNIVSSYSGYIEANSANFVDVILNLENTMLFGYMNNKFYRRKFLLDYNLTCKTMALKEDLEFNINVFKKLKSIYVLNKPCYFYKKRTNGGTLTAKFVPDYFKIHYDSVYLLKQLLEDLGELNAVSKKLLVNRFFRYFLSAIERNTNTESKLSIKDQVSWIKKIKNDIEYRWFFENRDLIEGKIKIIKPLLSNCPIGIIFLGYLIKNIKIKSPILFAKLKF